MAAWDSAPAALKGALAASLLHPHDFAAAVRASMLAGGDATARAHLVGAFLGAATPLRPKRQALAVEIKIEIKIEKFEASAVRLEAEGGEGGAGGRDDPFDITPARREGARGDAGGAGAGGGSEVKGEWRRRVVIFFHFSVFFRLIFFFRFDGSFVIAIEELRSAPRAASLLRFSARFMRQGTIGDRR